MKKKILIGIIIVIVVVVAGIYTITNNSNTDSKTNENTTVTTTEPVNNSNEEEVTKEENSSTNSSSENTNTPTTEPENSEPANTDDIESYANSQTASNKNEAVKKLLDFYLGEEDTFSSNITKITLTKNSDNTVTINKTEDDSNVFYAGVSAFSESSNEGLIITIENYDETNKVYSYTIKDLSDVKSGNTSNVLDSGTVPEKGNITSNLENK